MLLPVPYSVTSRWKFEISHVGVFTLQRSANATKRGLTVNCLDLRKWWRKHYCYRLNLKVWHVWSCYIVISTKSWGNIFPVLKTITWFSKEAAPVTDEWVRYVPLLFTFALLVYVNENTNRHLYWNYTCVSIVIIDWPRIQKLSKIQWQRSMRINWINGIYNSTIYILLFVNYLRYILYINKI